MKFFFLSLLGFIVWAVKLHGQVQLQQPEDEYKLNAVYLELGGPGLFYSVGFERTFIHSKQISVTTSIGLEYLPWPGGFKMFTFEPGVLFHITKRSAFEFGTALSYGGQGSYDEQGFSGSTYTNASDYVTLLFFRLGYRYTFNKNRTYIRCGITPVKIFDNGWEDDSGIHFWASIATIGFRF